MNSMQTEGKIIGYIVPTSIFPYCASIVYSQGDSLFVRYPSLMSRLIGPVTILDDLKKEIDNKEFKEKHPDASDLCDLFIDQISERKLTSDKYAYAISKDMILVDTPKNTYKQLERLVKECCLSDEEIKNVSEFLRANSDDA